MKTATTGALLWFAWMPLPLLGQSNQAQDDRVNRLANRVAELEQRIEALERLLVKRTTESVSSAKSHLADAMQRLYHSQRLFAKGYITRSQLKTDELSVAKAQVLLTRARGDKVDPQTLHSIELLEAETKLAVYQDLLRYAELRSSLPAEVEAWESRVQQARDELERVRRGEAIENTPTDK